MARHRGVHQRFVLTELSRFQALNQGQNLGLSAGFQSWLSTVEDRRLRQTTVFDCFGACLASIGAARVHRECSKARNRKAGRKWIFSTPGQTNPDVNVATWHKGVRRLVYTTDLAFYNYYGVPGANSCSWSNDMCCTRGRQSRHRLHQDPEGGAACMAGVRIKRTSHSHLASHALSLALPPMREPPSALPHLSLLL